MILGKNDLEKAYTDIRSKSFEGGCTVMLLVAKDVDAVCACRILTEIFQSENISYNIKPVDGYTEVRKGIDDFVDSHKTAKSIILINCGNKIDIQGEFRSMENVTFFVFDTHRPINEANVENTSNVFIFQDDAATFANHSQCASNEIDTHDPTPPLDTHITNEFTSTNDSRKRDRQDDKSADVLSKRPRSGDMHARGNTCCVAAAHLCYLLAKQLNKDSNDMLWMAIVGVTSYYVTGKIAREAFVNTMSLYRIEVTDKNPSNVQFSEADDGTTVPNTHIGRIDVADEFRLMLFRHWTFYQALFYSDYVVARLRTWKATGKAKLDEFLAKMGISKKQCNQKYNFMDLSLKNMLKEKLHSYGEEFSLKELSYESFQRNIGLHVKVSAADIVYSCNALLDCLAV